MFSVSRTVGRVLLWNIANARDSCEESAAPMPPGVRCVGAGVMRLVDVRVRARFHTWRPCRAGTTLLVAIEVQHTLDCPLAFEVHAGLCVVEIAGRPLRGPWAFQ